MKIHPSQRSTMKELHSHTCRDPTYWKLIPPSVESLDGDCSHIRFRAIYLDFSNRATSSLQASANHTSFRAIPSCLRVEARLVAPNLSVDESLRIYPEESGYARSAGARHLLLRLSSPSPTRSSKMLAGHFR